MSTGKEIYHEGTTGGSATGLRRNGDNDTKGGENVSPPVRIQLSRKKGWRMPPNTVKVTRPGKWGNPFLGGVARIETAAEAVQRFRTIVMSPEWKWIREQAAKELRGKNLACWCKPGAPCHADVLLELANSGTSTTSQTSRPTP